jgi:DMSO/TMAO reductase YedYZ molybdopterin-dependent catalytic subunit
MAQPPSHTTYSVVRKPVPRDLLVDRGTGTDYETRLSAVDGYLVPNDRFYLRSHSPTPDIDARAWSLRVDGDGVRRAVEWTYDDIRALPQVCITKALECAGNGRRFFRERHGSEADGVQWRLGAIGVAEWTGVRLRDLLEPAGIKGAARDVMPEGVDDHRGRRPMPLAKALADDTILALAMNGEPLPADHGFPARVIVPGWLGTASIKWVGSIHVAAEPLHVPWNTEEYVLAGPDYAAPGPAIGEPITEMPVMSMLSLDWPATLTTGRQVVHGRAYAGEGCVAGVGFRVDDGAWQSAALDHPNLPGAGVRFRFDWDATAGHHEIRTRAVDEHERAQPDSVPWNDKGCNYNAVVAHPIDVVGQPAR